MWGWIEKAQLQAQNIAKIRDTLLPMLISGHLVLTEDNNIPAGEA